MKRIRDKWVHNPFGVTLEENAEEALLDGLAFKPTPAHPPTAALIMATEWAANLMGANSEVAANL